MIQVTIYKNKQDQLKGFCISGHAGYDKRGRDIICASVSALSLNFINSVEKFTEDGFKTECKEEEGLLKFKFQGSVSSNSILLLESMIFGIENIRDSYGEKYVNIRFKEV